MSLDDLNKELYNGNSKVIPARMHEQSEYDPMISVSNPSPFNQNETWQREEKEIKQKRKKKFLIIGLSSFFAVVLIIGGIFLYRWWQRNAFQQDRVEISFEGPREADSTQPVKYIIRYKNNNYATLKNAEIQLSYSENFQPTDNLNLKYLSPSSSKIFVGDIKSMSEGTAELNGIFYAPKDSPVFLHAALNFMPSNGAKKLSMENQVSVNITAAPVMLSLITPKQAASGDEVEYDINYRNLDVRRISDTQIRVDFPQGFQMTSADPRPSEKDAYWYIGNLEPDQGGKIIIKGTLSGNDGESENVIASLGHTGGDNSFVVFNKQESSTKIIAPVLSVKQSIDGNKSIINAGDVLNYSVAYKNTGVTGLRNAIVTVEINGGKILDFSKINPDKGSYNDKTGIITWKASDVPGLASINPNSGGEVRFSIPVKTVIPIDSKLDKNFTVSTVAKIDSPDIPTPIDSNKVISSNKLELKLSTKVILETRAYFNDSKIKNSGSIPMKTGNETTFTIHWLITNVSNDLTNAKIDASLPSGIKWTGKTYPSGENITYDERTNKVTWQPGNVSAGSGILDSPREVAFQVGVTPQSNQVGQTITILNQSTLMAKDLFTGSDVVLGNDIKDTQLPEDPAVGYNNGKVVE